MPVVYQSGAEGSVWSFLTITPFILFKVRGSIVPQLLPQLLFIQGLSVLAVFMTEWEKENADEEENITLFGKVAEEGTKSFAILVSFLLVLKTQAANNQFWEALSRLTDMCHLLRSISIAICGMVTWEKHPSISQHAKRIIRLLVLYYFVVVEYFQRTGINQTRSKTKMDKLRADIAALAGDTEWPILYPGETKNTEGSKSSHPNTRPTIILFWITLSLRHISDHQGVEPPIMNGILGHLAAVSSSFWNMDKIDKTQFPFPYTQVVKWLTLVFLSMFPFALAPTCGWLTLVFSAVATVGFFGLDEVAEILESPFGNDPNDLDIRAYGDSLMSDLELMCVCRSGTLDFVLKDAETINFSALLGNFDDGGFHQRFCANLAEKREFQAADPTDRTTGAEFIQVLPGKPQAD